MPKRPLKKRLLIAATLAMASAVALFLITEVVSGGLGKEGHWEGNAMAAYLVAQGTPEAAVIVDNEGSNTYHSARNFVAIAEAHQMETVIVVSQFFHISRTRLILGKLGVTRVGAAHSTLYTRRDIYSTLREFPAYIKYALVY